MRPVYASDIYALGVTCMYLMSGKAPKNMECDPITGDINWFKYADVSDGFAEILTKMLEVAVKSRYKTAQEALDVLDLEKHVDSLAGSMLSNTAPIESNISTNRTGIGSSRRSQMTDRTARGAGGKSATASRYSRSSARTTNQRTQMGQTTSLDQGAKAPPKPVKISAEEILSAYDAGRKDFGLKDLSMQNLQKANLSESKFYDSKLIRVDFQGADLSRSNFNNCDVRQAMFRNADLNKCMFYASNLEGVDLRGANLSGSNFKNAKLKGANLCGTNLSDTNLTKEQLEETKTNWMTTMPTGKRGFW
jgi:serine/threonine-protein kinase